MARDYKVTAKPKMRPVHPGSILREDVLPALDVSIVKAAKELGVSRQLLHGILSEKLPISADVAVRLGKWCGNGAYFWQALQGDYDVWEATTRLAGKVKNIPTRKAA